MSVSIRPADGSDRDAVWTILEPIFRAGETYCLPRDIPRDQGLAFWFGGGHQVFIAESGGARLGTYYICPNQRGGGAHVCNCGFATASAAQGKGVARAMLTHALEEAVRQGFRAMQFNFVVASNTRAVETWTRAGFETVGRLPGAFDHPRLGYVDALVMMRDLTDRQR